MAMKWILSVLLIFIPTSGFAFDHMIELFEEHYKEKMMVGGGEMKVYHSWQVKTEFGNKLIVIVGDDHDYRTWLRKWADNHILFVVKIPEMGEDDFRFDRTVLVNVQQIHDVWEKKWRCSNCRHGPPPLEKNHSEE